MNDPREIPAWEIPMLQEISAGRYPAAREEALRAYIIQRAKRKRYAAVRDQRDRERRTLLGAHVNMAKAHIIHRLADLQGVSITAWVLDALERKAQRQLLDYGWEQPFTLNRTQSADTDQEIKPDQTRRSDPRGPRTH